MRLWGLTGGIGSGKSEVAKLLAAAGIPVLNADAIGHKLLEREGACFKRVVEEFGESVLSAGAVDREKLASLVFANSEARRLLNAILHPQIQSEIALECAKLAEQGHSLAVIEAALLSEGGKKEPFLAGLILVTCPAEIRIQRLMDGRGMPRDEVLRRIAAQTPPESKLALADHVIDNSGELKALEDRVDKLVEELRAQ
ncbi:MAG: dephospho-CoA kinase [Candidatus Hydrogenedentes bacterium]|nr:dephospho-CoA kinase [Candidatus Hydrogenedentota bacterium]